MLVLPSSVEEMQDLEKLTLDNSQFELLPKEPFTCSKLNILNLFSTRLTSLLSQIGRLKNLEELRLVFRVIAA